MRILPRYYTAIIYYQESGHVGFSQITVADGVARSLEGFNKLLDKRPNIEKAAAIQVIEGRWLQRLGVLFLPNYFPKYKGKWVQTK